MKLSVVIVSWNVRELLADCLRSVAEHAPKEAFEVIVVDNASTDGTAEVVRRGFPQVTLRANDRNAGFAAACNQGMAGSSGAYVLLLNPDTLVHPHTLDTLCAFMDRNPDVGACGPRLLNDDGTTQRSARRFPSFRGALYRYTILRHLRLFRRHYERWLMTDFPHNQLQDVDQLMGAALLLRRSVLNQVGLVDERFFMYYEEVDLCRRIRQAGRRIVFLPDATITHLAGRSTSQVPVARRVMMFESLLRYFRKHRGRVATGLFNCVFKPGVLAKELCDVVGGAVAYLASLSTRNQARRRRSALKIRGAAALLGKHSWWLLFKA